MPWQSEKTELLKYISRAAGLAERIRKDSSAQSKTKPDGSPVTPADLAVQIILRKTLNLFNPGVPVIAEETEDIFSSDFGSGLYDTVLRYAREIYPNLSLNEIMEYFHRADSSGTDAFWVLDPIDGTLGFIGSGQYVIALAHVCGKEVQETYLACPRLELTHPISGKRIQGVLAIARRHEGTFWVPLDSPTSPPIPMKVSNKDNVKSSNILASRESSHMDIMHWQKILAALGPSAHVTPLDSQVKYVYLAAGIGDVYIRIPPRDYPPRADNIWDHAPGSLLVKEAGGMVTDLRGNPLDFSQGLYLSNNYGILATNALLHKAFLEILSFSS